jgi:hypothetical protein
MSKPSRLTRLHALAVTVLVLSLLPTPTSRASAPPRPPVVLASASPLRWKLEQRVGASRLAW